MSWARYSIPFRVHRTRVALPTPTTNDCSVFPAKYPVVPIELTVQPVEALKQTSGGTRDRRRKQRLEALRDAGIGVPLGNGVGEDGLRREDVIRGAVGH